MSLLVYFLGSFVLLFQGGQSELTWYKMLSARLDDIVFDMRSKDNSITTQVQELKTMVTATNQQLASFEKRLSAVAELVAVEERFANIDNRLKDVAAAEAGRRTHLLRRGLEQEKAATMTRFESLQKNQEKILLRMDDIERFQGAIMTRADDMYTQLNETRIQISNVENELYVTVYNTSNLFESVGTLENMQVAMKGTEEKSSALVAAMEQEVKSTQHNVQKLQSQVQTLVDTQESLQSKTRTIEAKVDTTRAEISRLTEDKTRALIAVIEEQVKSTQNNFHTLKSQVQTLVGKQADLQSKTGTIEAQVDTTRDDISRLQRIVSVDGQWGAWTSWSLCTWSHHCTQTRTRACNNPAPLHFGRDCPGLTTQTQECNTSSCGGKDCTELLSRGAPKRSGVYNITTPLSHTKIQVLCDMETDGGGWTVFQKRFNGSEDFYRNFSDYEKGFGTVYAEHWLGLKYIYEITTRGSYQLRVDIVRSNGSKGYDVYGGFSLSPGTNYTLNVGSRVRSDGLLNTDYSFSDGASSWAPVGNAFSTYDHDVDRLSGFNCAAEYKGGWWYNDCYNYINLNSLYRPKLNSWIAMIYDSDYGLAASTMMFKSVS
ncbi:fibrinogen C domain-containing protein 1-like isoform X4 [Dreissena polymorpha]|uniref:fibrinogen C domain-containing protein 1-like isoform X4 n=1 Tax=Dreissena polymorpha TaxID=45954 RepID=UPI002264BCF9|nr:fibrinogen C domain-containing protein 1-like isoform X4 [Dreissena polymorpha]